MNFLESSFSTVDSSSLSHGRWTSVLISGNVCSSIRSLDGYFLFSFSTRHDIRLNPTNSSMLKNRGTISFIFDDSEMIVVICIKDWMWLANTSFDLFISSRVMRFSPLLLLGVLLFAALALAERDEELDQNAHDGEEESEPRKTKGKTRKTSQQCVEVEDNWMLTCATWPSRKTELQDDDYPHCYTEMINGRPAYFCERTVDEEKQKFGIKFSKQNSFICGEFQDNEVNGPGFKLYLDDQYEKKNFCGDFISGNPEGYTSWYFFEFKNLQMGKSAVRKKFPCTEENRFLPPLVER